MTIYRCAGCEQPVTAGNAVVRSVNLRLTAWHPVCYEGPAVIPAQRQGGHDSLNGEKMTA